MRRLKFFLLFCTVLAATLWGLRVYPVPFGGALEPARDLLLLGVLLLLTLATGRLILKRFTLFCHTLTEELVFSFGLGCMVFSLLAQALGSFGLLKFPTILLLLSAWGFGVSDHLEYFLASLARAFRPRPHAPAAPAPADGPLAWLSWGALWWTGLALLPLALAPVTFYDSLLYHLAMPQEWLKTGWTLPLAHNLFTWLPHAGELYWSLCLGLDGPNSSLPALFNLSCGVMAGLGLAAAMRRFVPEGNPVLGAALFLSQSVAALAFGALIPDGLMSLLCLLSLLALLNASQDRNHQFKAAWIRLAFLLAGAAVAVKGVALLHALALAPLLGWMAWREKALRRPWLALSCLGLALAPLLPGLAQSAWLTGNPFYPFGLSLFGKEFLRPASASYLASMATYGLAGQPWWRQALLLPWDLTFHAGLLGGDGTLSPLFLGLLPAALLLRPGRELKMAFAYLACFGLLWALTGQVLRYTLGALPAACLLAAFAVGEVRVWARSRGLAFAWELLVGLGLVVAAAQTSLIVVKDFDPVRVSLGLESRQQYLRDRVSYAAAADWAQEHLPADAGILVLGESRTAYLPGRPLAASPFEEHPFSAWLRQSRDVAQLDEKVKEAGCSWVLINQAEWRRLDQGPPPHYDYFDDARERNLFRDWERDGLALKFERDGALLYKVRPRPLPPPPSVEGIGGFPAPFKS